MVNSLLEMPTKQSANAGLVTRERTMRLVDPLQQPNQLQPEERSHHASDHLDASSEAYLLYAKPILTLMMQVKQSATMPNVKKLHQQFIEEINMYIQELEQVGCSSFLIDCAAYCLCAAVDETVLATEWGTQSIWVQKSLLSMFRSETLGGERFYLIIHRLSEEPRKHIGVIELIYTILSLGFEGQYYGRHKEKRNEIKNQLYYILTKERGKIVRQLSPQWTDVQTTHYRLKRKKTLTRLAFGGLACVVLLYAWYSIAMYKMNHPIMQRLDAIGHESPITAYSQLINRELFVHHDEGGQNAA